MLAEGDQAGAADGPVDLERGADRIGRWFSGPGCQAPRENPDLERFGIIPARQQ
jgi:hypothetical protein